jgi:hypothetical protein
MFGAFGKGLGAMLGVGVGCVILVIAVVVIAGMSVGSLRSPAASSAPVVVRAGSPLPMLQDVNPSRSPTAKTWVAVKEWSGSGIKDTEDFIVGNEWRIDWIFTPGQFAGLIQIYVYRTDTKQLVNLAANTQKAGSDTSFQRGAGTYYMKINSANGDWKVAVQDFR